MSWIVTNMEWVLIVCGVLTTTMLFPMLAPRRAFSFMFGEAADGPLKKFMKKQYRGERK